MELWTFTICDVSLGMKLQSRRYIFNKTTNIFELSRLERICSSSPNRTVILYFSSNLILVKITYGRRNQVWTGAKAIPVHFFSLFSNGMYMRVVIFKEICNKEIGEVIYSNRTILLQVNVSILHLQWLTSPKIVIPLKNRIWKQWR